MNVNPISCEAVKGEDVELNYDQIHKFVFGEEHDQVAEPIPSLHSTVDNSSSIGSTSGETKTSWTDDPLLGVFHNKEDRRWTDLSELGDPWCIDSTAVEGTTNVWENIMNEPILDSKSSEVNEKPESSEHGTGDLVPEISSMLSEIGEGDQCFSTQSSLIDIPLKHTHRVLPRNSNGIVHDDEFVRLYHTEMEFNQLMSSATDPVGKFLKNAQFTAQDAVELNLHDKLFNAPKTPRTKYGKRRFISKEERYVIQKERNKIHARATRSRRKLFKEVVKAREEALSRSSQSESQSMTSAANGNEQPHN